MFKEERTFSGEFVTIGTFNCHIVNYGLYRSKTRKLCCRTYYPNVQRRNYARFKCNQWLHERDRLHELFTGVQRTILMALSHGKTEPD